MILENELETDDVYRQTGDRETDLVRERAHQKWAT